MVMSESEAVRNYENGIEAIGVQAYRQASDATSISEAAEALESAKDDSLTVDQMSSKWRNRY